MLTIAEFEQYNVNALTGFVPITDPLLRLPPYYDPWEQIGRQIGDLLMTGQLRAFIERLPQLTLDRLDSAPARQRAMLLLSVMGNAYVWGGAAPAAILPAPVAVPWSALADELGRPPIAAHESMVLNNWRRIEPQAPVSLSNVASLVQFLGGMDEQWFYLITLQIELDGAPAIAALVKAQAAVRTADYERLTRLLLAVNQCLTAMSATLNRMMEKCDPNIFYKRIRPFFTGWSEPGLIYAGVSLEPRLLIGGSAAQSSLIQALDVGLGVDHSSPKSGPFLREMRRYMPRPHREFLEALGAGTAIYPYIVGCASDRPQLAAAYNACINQLAAFRQKHIEISVRYIVHQAPDSEGAVGTGGTSFVPFLSEARKETKRQQIGSG